MASTQEIVEAYVAAWNEPDADKRKKLIEQCWADDALYCDPQADIRGRDGLEATIAGFHAQGNTPIEGVDVGELAADGRLARIVGFWGQSQPR
jgi:hypothetical protein